MKYLVSSILIVSTLLFGSCASPGPSQRSDKGDSATGPAELRHDGEMLGAVVGRAFDCEQTPLGGANLALTLMPDSLLHDTTGIVREMRLFHDSSLYVTTTADAEGYFTFAGIPTGSYQVILRTSGKPAQEAAWTCGSSAVDRVEVILDSAAVVDIHQVNENTEVVYTARIWSPDYQPLH